MGGVYLLTAFSTGDSSRVQTPVISRTPMVRSSTPLTAANAR